jgi:hypothetical protein
MAKAEILKIFNNICKMNDPPVKKISSDTIRRMAEFLNEDFAEDEIREMMEEADKDGDGWVTEDDFLRIMKKTSIYSTT